MDNRTTQPIWLHCLYIMTNTLVVCITQTADWDLEISICSHRDVEACICRSAAAFCCSRRCKR